MKNKDINSLVLEYLKGGLNAGNEKKLRTMLMEYGYDIDELEELRKTWQRMDDIPVPQPGDRMTDNFYRMLDDYKRQKRTEKGLWDRLVVRLTSPHFQSIIQRAAAGIVLLFMGWSLGFWFTPKQKYDERLNYMSSEIHQMKEMIVLAELKQPSPNERIRAINQIKAYSTVDERTITMLLNVLNDDSNTNVRLVAIEALVAHADRIIVKQGLIQALDHQESPLVQLALTDAVVDLKEKQAIGPLRSMLEREDLNYVVRTKIENSLSLLM
jgi:hypothetical protein